MSCRIISAAQDVTVRPLFEQETPSSHAAGAAIEKSGVAPHPQVTELHGRIVELECALQRDVLQARQSGFREGEAAGRESAVAETQAAMERLVRSTAELAGAKARLRREAEQDLVQLSIAIARRILRRELTVDPEAIGGLVRAALDKLQARDICRIRVHPDHQSIVRRLLDRQSVTSAEVVADAALHPGDVIVESKRGDLDASIESQLAEIEHGFADRLKRWGP